jgi:two-component system, response regulator PdtaR
VAPEMTSAPNSASEPSRILIVEDEIFIRLALAHELTDAGFLVLQAAHADAALRVLQDAMQIKLMITDIRMPGTMDGIELARRARTMWPQLKIMFLSGNLPDVPPCLAVDGFITKPYNPAVVIAHVQRLLNWRPPLVQR